MPYVLLPPQRASLDQSAHGVEPKVPGLSLGLIGNASGKVRCEVLAVGRSEAFSMSRLEGSRWRLRRAREMRPAMEFGWVLFRLLFGPNVNAGTSKAAEKRRRYHLIRGGSFHAQRPPRQGVVLVGNSYLGIISGLFVIRSGSATRRSRTVDPNTPTIRPPRRWLEKGVSARTMELQDGRPSNLPFGTSHSGFVDRSISGSQLKLSPYVVSAPFRLPRPQRALILGCPLDSVEREAQIHDPPHIPRAIKRTGPLVRITWMNYYPRSMEEQEPEQEHSP